jgi:hypothetical protein
VFDIIAYASKAFALYYAIQSAIAMVGDWKTAGGFNWRTPVYAGLSMIGILIVVFGVAAEGSAA